MALFKSLFGKNKDKAPRGFSSVAILSVDRLSPDSVKISLDVPKDGSFDYIPGQYINVALTIKGEEQRRSYSICSGKNEPLAIAIKEVDKGRVSMWFNREAAAGTEILVSKPEGNFIKPAGAKNCVAIAAGSGITPIMSIAKQLEGNGTLRLFYGNKTAADILFKSEIDALQSTTAVYYLSQEENDFCEKGRITKDAFVADIKRDLSILQSDAFFLCGPLEMIENMREALEMFGVAKEKVFFELFTAQTTEATKEDAPSTAFSGKSKITLIMNGDEEVFDLDVKKTILEGALSNSIDAPYSCRGGVCSTCKAKITSGTAMMNINYSLTDKEIEDGFILTCQAHPTSSEVTINYD